jgi:hypothetical protein
MKNKFKVLLIDDNKDVLDRVKGTVQKDIKAGKLMIRVEVETLHVRLRKISETEIYRVDEDTVKRLAQASTEKFDYIFSDFGYVGNKDLAEDLRKRLLTANKGVTKEDIQGNILQLIDIKKSFEEFSSDNRINGFQASLIISNFLNHEGDVLVYTNSPKPFDNYFDRVEIKIRENEVKEVFSKAGQIKFILMHDEFAIKPEIEALFTNPDERKKYFSLLLSTFIDQLMQFAALSHMVISQEKLRLKNTKKAFQRLTKFGIGLGAVVALFGEVIFHFMHKVISLILEKLDLQELDKNIVFNSSIVVFLIICCLILFPYWGIKIAKATEDEVDNLI